MAVVRVWTDIDTTDNCWNCCNDATPLDCDVCNNTRFLQCVQTTVEEPMPDLGKVSRMLGWFAKGSLEDAYETAIQIRDLERQIAQDKAENEALRQMVQAKREELLVLVHGSPAKGKTIGVALTSTSSQPSSPGQPSSQRPSSGPASSPVPASAPPSSAPQPGVPTMNLLDDRFPLRRLRWPWQRGRR